MGVRIPEVGEVLVHRFRRQPGEIQAIVVRVNQERPSVAVQVDSKEYASLSAAATAISGTSRNGWIFWGLKKQKARQSRLSNPQRLAGEQEAALVCSESAISPLD